MLIDGWGGGNKNTQVCSPQTATEVETGGTFLNIKDTKKTAQMPVESSWSVFSNLPFWIPQTYFCYRNSTEFSLFLSWIKNKCWLLNDSYQMDDCCCRAALTLMILHYICEYKQLCCREGILWSSESGAASRTRQSVTWALPTAPGWGVTRLNADVLHRWTLTWAHRV